MAMKHAPGSGRANGHHGATGFTCAPTRETFKLPARRMLEPISLRFDGSREKEAACLDIDAGGRKQVSVTVAPIRSTVASPRSFNTTSREFIYCFWPASPDTPDNRTNENFRRDGRTRPGLITRAQASRFNLIMLQLRL